MLDRFKARTGLQIRLVVVAAIAESLSGCGTDRPITIGAPAETKASDSARAAPLDMDLATWRKAMARTPLPKTGCFHASHPRMTWDEVPCVSPPASAHFGPGAGSNVFTVGAGSGDFIASVSGTTISFAQGRFPTVTNVTSEHGSDGTANRYSLQLNTNTFVTAACNGVSGCRGWQQFIYTTGFGQILIESWLLFYNNTCILPWVSDLRGNCYINSFGPSIAGQPISNLANLVLIGTAANDTDSVLFDVGNGEIYSSIMNTVLFTSQGWTSADFNIFGDSGASPGANFDDANATVVVQLTFENGSVIAPTCVVGNSTAETNNLSLLSGSCCPYGGIEPAISFTETNATGVSRQFCPSNDNFLLIAGEGALL